MTDLKSYTISEIEVTKNELIAIGQLYEDIILNLDKNFIWHSLKMEN